MPASPVMRCMRRLKCEMFALLVALACSDVSQSRTITVPDSVVQQQIAARKKFEATCPFYELPDLLLFRNKDGTLTFASASEYVPRGFYVWKGIRIDPKNIPYLDVIVEGSDIYPRSIPYESWTKAKFTMVDPPAREYCWSDSDKGFATGYYRHSFFYRIGSNIYKADQIPPRAETYKGLEIIPMLSPKS